MSAVRKLEFLLRYIRITLRFCLISLGLLPNDRPWKRYETNIFERRAIRGSNTRRPTSRFDSVWK